MQPIPYPQPIPPCRSHRCRLPWLHSLGMVSLVGLWVWYSLHTMGTWGRWLAPLLDRKGAGWGLAVAVFTDLAWVLLLPCVSLALLRVSMWRCTGPPRFRPVDAPGMVCDPAGPRVVRRVILEEVYYPDERSL